MAQVTAATELLPFISFLLTRFSFLLLLSLVSDLSPLFSFSSF